MGNCTADAGRQRRLARIFRRSGRLILVALDDALISGPHVNLNRARGLPALCEASGADAVMGHIGTFIHQYIPPALGRVVNLSASTSRATPTRKVIVSSVEQALRVDADAVAYQLHIGSEYESSMLRDAGSVVRESSRYALPTLLVAYPRAEHTDGSPHEFEELRNSDFDEYVRLCGHSARIAVELGADVVKVRYPGTPESFATVVAACEPVPVLIAGGPYRDAGLILADTRDAISVGGAGVAVGRSVFESSSPGDVVRALDDLEKSICAESTSVGEQ
jgi:DhnA family fructose-bisphosphate aldolase class Ia